MRRIVDAAAPGGFAGALERELLGPLGLADTSLALELGDLDGLVPGWSTQIGDGRQDVRGRYHPRWVGHRTLASTCATSAASGPRSPTVSSATSRADRGGRDRLRRTGLHAAELRARCDEDPGRPDGLLIGHGGGGPGYAAAAFAVLRPGDDPLVAVELSGDERVDVQAQALDALRPTTSG